MRTGIARQQVRHGRAAAATSLPAPGAPDEDPVGFPFGGWQAPLMDEGAGAQNAIAHAPVFAAGEPDESGESGTDALPLVVPHTDERADDSRAG